MKRAPSNPQPTGERQIPISPGGDELDQRLHAERRGRGPRLIMVHGFSQTGRSWGRFAEELAEHHEIVTVDAPGHGRSSAVSADLPAAAGLVVRAGGRGNYLGYSMGARICLRAALDHPGEVSSLVLISGSPGIADPVEREARRLSDKALARSIVDVDDFLDRWLEKPLFRGLAEGRSERDSRLENTPEGLRSSLDHCGTGSQEALWDRLHELDMPVLLVAGANDEKFSGIACAMKSAIGASARLALVDGAGHAAHLEKPSETAATVLGFLD